MTNKINEILDIISSLLQREIPHEEILKFLNEQRSEVRLSIFEKKIEELYGYIPEIKHSDIVFIESFKDKTLEVERNKIFGQMIYNASQKLGSIFENVQTLYFFKGGSAACSSLDFANSKVMIDEEISLIKPKIVICCNLDIAKFMIYNQFEWEKDKGKIYSEEPIYVALDSCYLLAEHPKDEATIKKEIWEGLKKISG